MIQVVDLSGRPVPGMYKDKLGNIIISDSESYRKYRTALNKSEEVVALKNEVAELKNQMKLILEKLNG